MFNKDLRVIEANDKALKAYNYPLAEMVKLGLKELQAPDTIAAFPSEMEKIAKTGNTVFTTTHRRKDGTTFPVEISMQHFIIEWNEFYQAIIRDLDERKEYSGITL
jgi:PAS domain S-box-containing protein